MKWGKSPLSALGALLLGNGVEGDDQAAESAAAHIGKALNGAVQAAEHLSHQNLLGGSLASSSMLLESTVSPSIKPAFTVKFSLSLA